MATKPTVALAPSIWMVCTPVTASPGMQDGAFVAVEFVREYLDWLRQEVDRCRRIKDPRLYRITYFDSGTYWLKRLWDDMDDAVLGPIADAVSEGGSSGWFQMPVDWRPLDEWQCRIELQMVNIGKEDLLYEFREKHSDFDFETPTLSAAALEDMLRLLSEPSHGR